MFDDGGVLGQRAKNVRFDQVLVLLRPTRVALAKRTTLGALLDRVLADGIGEHLRRELVGGGEIDFVPEIQKKDIGFFSTAHRRDVGRG